MGCGTDGDSPPKSTRQQLSRSLAAAGLGDGKPVTVPWDYALDALAKRWNIAPWELEQAPNADWIIRGLYFQKVEAQAQASAARVRSKRG